MQDLPSGKPVVTDTTSSILDRAAEAAARATPDSAGEARQGPFRPDGRLDLHRADDRALARDQHLPADLGDPALLHQLPGEPAERADQEHRALQLFAHPDRHRHLDRHAGDRAFRVLDDPAADADRLYARLSDRPQVPRPRLLDDHHPGADDAVAGGGRQFLALPLRAADRALHLCRLVLHRHPDDRHIDAVQRDAGAVGDHHRRHLDVDALRDADLPRRACAPSPTTSTRPPRSTAPPTGGSSGRSRCRWRCPSSCSPCSSAASRTSRCSTW